MPKVKVAGNPAHDATYPTVPLTLDGRTYHLAFTIGSLSAASKALAVHAALEQAEANQSGQAAPARVNLFAAFYTASLDFHTLPAMLYAALLPSEPTLEYAGAIKLVTIGNAFTVYQAVSQAYADSLTPKDEADPNQ